jgi:hypothetical protein
MLAAKNSEIDSYGFPKWPEPVTKDFHDRSDQDHLLELPKTLFRARQSAEERLSGAVSQLHAADHLLPRLIDQNP